MPEKPRQTADELLNLFLIEKDNAKSERLLGQLISEHTEPFVKTFLIKRLREGVSTEEFQHFRQEVDDWCSELILQLIQILSDVRDGKKKIAIRDFQAYIARATHNKLRTIWREKNPIWSSFKHKIQYLLEKHPKFILWRDGDLMMCCLDSYKKEYTTLTVEELVEAFKSNERSMQQEHLLDLATLILKQADGSLPVKDLIAIAFELQEIKDMSDIPLEEIIGAITHGDSHQGEQENLEMRQKIRGVWEEIAKLPMRQRIALLLGRDKNGKEMISLLLYFRAVTLNELIECLKMTPTEFAEVYDRLPLSDNEISERLKATQTQVSNLRMAARKRLKYRIGFTE